MPLFTCGDLDLDLGLAMLFRSWSCKPCKQRSWSCYFGVGLGLGLKNLVLFTSLVPVAEQIKIHSFIFMLSIQCVIQHTRRSTAWCCLGIVRTSPRLMLWLQENNAIAIRPPRDFRSRVAVVTTS